MKIKDLLKEIEENNLPPDADISFEMYSGCCGDVEYLETCDIVSYNDESFKSLQIRFRSLPGYTSCIKAGATHRDSVALARARTALVKQIYKLENSGTLGAYEQRDCIKILESSGYHRLKPKVAITCRFPIHPASFSNEKNTYRVSFFSVREALNYKKSLEISGAITILERIKNEK
jgi:hypothetical protein